MPCVDGFVKFSATARNSKLGAESILIFGPGEAKGELKERLERKNLGGSILGIETVDKMTDRQIAAKVRQYFPQ
jgi:hypothetical protein